MKSADISATVESMRGEADRLALALARVLVLARLHDRRVQVQVVRHHRRAEDADGDVEHRRGLRRISARGMKPAATAPRSGLARARARSANEPAMSDDQRDDERLDVAEAVVLQEQHDAARRAR